MATDRCVPGSALGLEPEWPDGLVEFADGKRTVPELYRRYLEPGQRQSSLTYEDWKRQTVDAQATRRLFQSAVRQMIQTHFGR